MSNREKLKQLVLDVFLLDQSEFRWDLCRRDIRNWDSLGTVALALGLTEAFGCPVKPYEVSGKDGLPTVVAVLKEKGIDLDL